MNKSQEVELDIYGKVGSFEKRSLTDCPFRYQEAKGIKKQMNDFTTKSIK